MRLRLAVNVALVSLVALLPACGGGGGGGGGGTPTGPQPGPSAPPNYAGNWSGTYAVSSCTNTGFFVDAGLCASALNSTASVSFALAQTDRTVTGTFMLGSLTSAPVTAATIGADGAVSLVANVVQAPFTINTTWTLQQATAGAITGQTRQVWSASGQSGEGVVQGAIVSVARSGS